MKTKQEKVYHPNPYLNELMAKALSGDKKLRPEVLANVALNVQAYVAELRTQSDISESQQKTEMYVQGESALYKASLKKIKGGK